MVVRRSSFVETVGVLEFLESRRSQSGSSSLLSMESSTESPQSKRVRVNARKHEERWALSCASKRLSKKLSTGRSSVYRQGQS